MSKIKVAIYLALIFIAGAIAGGAVVMSSPDLFFHGRPPRPHPSPEEFANHVWNQLKERLQLTDEQIAKIEPIFRAGFAEVSAIQEKTLQQVEAAVRKNHEEMAQFLSQEQRDELQKMDEERRVFIMKRSHGPPGPGPGRPKQKTAPQ